MTRWKWKIDWPGVRAQLFWLAIWAIVYLTWGHWKYRTAEFGSPEWMFDNIGHALGGILGGANGMYTLWYLFPFLYYERGRTLRWLVIYIVVPMVVGFLAIVFEGIEMAHDFQNYSTQLQKGGADTTIDIILAIVFAYAGVALWHGYSWIRKRWSSEATQEKIAELKMRIGLLREKEKQIKEERRELVREYRALTRAQTKEITPGVITELKDALGMTKDDEEDVQ